MSAPDFPPPDATREQVGAFLSAAKRLTARDLFNAAVAEWRHRKDAPTERRALNYLRDHVLEGMAPGAFPRVLTAFERAVYVAQSLAAGFDAMRERS